MSKHNINTKEYWEHRFASKDWEENKGRWQTKSFAKGFIKYLKVPSDFSGTLVDFGCALGDAMLVYKGRFPSAKLIGVDISNNAIKICNEKYSEIATFIQSEHSNVPESDVIIASNVFEHLSDDLDVAKILLSKCRSLFIIVPYKECPLHPEHVNTYDEHYYSSLGEHDYKIFPWGGLTLYGILTLWYFYLKNIIRFLLGRKPRHKPMQIMFSFVNHASKKASVK